MQRGKRITGSELGSSNPREIRTTKRQRHNEIKIKERKLTKSLQKESAREREKKRQTDRQKERQRQRDKE